MINHTCKNKLFGNLIKNVGTFLLSQQSFRQRRWVNKGTVFRFCFVIGLNSCFASSQESHQKNLLDILFPTVSFYMFFPTILLLNYIYIYICIYSILGNKIDVKQVMVAIQRDVSYYGLPVYVTNGQYGWL